MKRVLLLMILTLALFAIIASCGKKTEEQTDKVPVETKQAEMMDSTRMDSGMQMTDSTMMDSTEMTQDSM